MLIVELSGATIGRVFDDNAKILAASATELYAYEIPHDDTDTDTSDCEDYTHQTNGEDRKKLVYELVNCSSFSIEMVVSSKQTVVVFVVYSLTDRTQVRLNVLNSERTLILCT